MSLELPPRIRVMIVDDHPMLRAGVSAVLRDEPDVELVAEAADGAQALVQFRAHRPDVTLMDLRMPAENGIDAIVAIRSEFPTARVIVLTTYQGDVNALRALKAGAAGYLLKGALRNDLVDAIRVVHAGGRRIPPEIAADLASHLGGELLTTREIDVLRSVARGNSNKRVALELGLSEDTIKAHMKNIISKLDANDRTHAVTIGLKRGIIEL